MSTVLVTGGCGFIGTNFVRWLLGAQRAVGVVNLDALTYAGNLENLREFEREPRHVFVRGDIRDHALVTELVQRHGVEGVINFAAESHVDRSIAAPNIFIETNVSGTLNLLQVAVAAKLKRFLQVSTDEVYGSLAPAAAAFTEATPLGPNSPYAASKAAADLLVQAFRHTHGLDTVITRCSNNYGPYQFPEKLIPLMFNNAQHDEPLPVYGDGQQVRDWLYVADHCTAVWAAYERGRAGAVYNVGGGNEQANLAVVRLILEYLGKPASLIRHVTDRPGHDRRYAIDAGKLRRELGWAPAVTFAAGLRQTLDWYVANAEWLRQVTSGAYRQYYDRMYQNR